MSDSVKTLMSQDYIDRYPAELDAVRIMRRRAAAAPMLNAEKARPWRAAVESVGEVRPSMLRLDAATIQIGRHDDLTDDQHRRLRAALDAFRPWKKGPFSLYGTEIDAEWRSDQKFARLEPVLGNLGGKRVADIGCHNGYFMLRLSPFEPELIVGFDPVAKNSYHFALLQHLAAGQLPAPIFFEPVGVEHLSAYPAFFDTILCLGVLYHMRDPVRALIQMHKALRRGGHLIIESQGIAGDAPIALVPRSRYANTRGVWFLPTESCLQSLLHRAGFSKIETFYSAPLAVEEQRRTAWADIASLADFLDPDNLTKTREGYPAPWRIYCVCRK